MNKKKLALIKKIVEEHFSIIETLTVGGKKTLSPTLLKKLGLKKETGDLILDSYRFGSLTTTQVKGLEKLSVKEVEALLKNVSLTPAQTKAIDWARLNAEVHLESLKAKITATVLSTAIQDATNFYSTIGAVIPKAIEENTDRYKVIQKLREASGDWKRDWSRVAMTEMQGAKMNGLAQSILSGSSPLSNKRGKTLVFKRPAPDCCKQCKKAYLEPNGTPRVFTLDELLANGTNYGKKAADWKPVVGPLHPNCICQLSILPEGFSLDKNGNLVPVE